jgi:hypothetical protein
VNAKLRFDSSSLNVIQGSGLGRLLSAGEMDLAVCDGSEGQRPWSPVHRDPDQAAESSYELGKGTHLRYSTDIDDSDVL